jgi:hypothetical protein
MITAANIKQEIPIPSQQLFVRACELCRAFLEGYVNSDDLDQLIVEASASDECLKPTVINLLSGAGPYKIDKDGNGCPIIITDSFYPNLLAEIMRKNTNKDGLVISMSPRARSFIKALLTDGASRLERHDPAPEP